MKTEYEMYFKDNFTLEEAKKKGLTECMFCEQCGFCISCKDCKCKKPRQKAKVNNYEKRSCKK